MKHSIDFFRDEIRNGFYVPTQVKASWASDLDVLSEIDRICRKHDISYFADWGTFLGAVRHGGFVPWDDDMDICMLRDDYDRFRAVADAELPKEYVIHDFERQEDHWLFLSRVVKKNHICFEEKYLTDNYNFPWLSGIDIFIKDYLYSDPEKEKERCDEILKIIAIADAITEGSYSQSAIESRVHEISLKYNTSLPSCKDKRALSVALYALAEKQMARAPQDNAEKIGQIFPWILKGQSGEPKSYYKPPVYIPFEDTTIPVPSHYNELLSLRYSNYNEIRKVWDGHTYPTFEEQKKSFEKESGTSLPEFTFSQDMIKRISPNKEGSYKELCKECLDGLKSLYSKVVKSLSGDNCDLDAITQNLNEMQQLALDMGTLIESVKGENNPRVKNVVSVLEKLCEDIYNLHISKTAPASSGSDASSLSTTDTLGTISATLDTLSETLKCDILDIKEALFLPIGITEWYTMKNVYDSIIEDPGIDCIVMPLPLYSKDVYGRPTMSTEEIISSTNYDKYPDDLPLSHWQEYNIALHCPEQVYIQNPYDNENPLLTVPPAFYAQNIVKYADELVYMPIGATAEFDKKDIPDHKCMKYYVVAPGVVYADKVLVQSENIKKQYVDALTDFAGESTKDYWNSKIHADQKVYSSAYKSTTYAKLNDSSKKNILYCISLYEFTEHQEDIVDIVRSRLETLSGAKDKIDAKLCFYPENIETTDPALLKTITDARSAIMNEAQKRGIETIPLSKDVFKDIVTSFSAYYGSSSPLVQEFVSLGKPVMISNYNI